MATTMKLLVVVPVMLAIMQSALVTADLSHGNNVDLADGEGETPQCWEALMELKSCSNEIILFFFNGEVFLGDECCKAIRIVTLKCWPSMLTTMGFTAEEADVLRDYCGAPAPSPTSVAIPTAA